MSDIQIDILTLINMYKQTNYGPLGKSSNLKQMQQEQEQIQSLDRDQSQLLDLSHMQKRQLVNDIDLEGLHLQCF